MKLSEKQQKILSGLTIDSRRFRIKGKNMKCHRCKTAITDNSAHSHKEEILCEECYIDSLCNAKPVCNPWEEYLSTRTAAATDEENISQLKSRRNFELLLQEAFQMGATDAALIKPSRIEISEDLAGFCKSPKCEGYGRSMSCPPHVSGPEGILKTINSAANAIVFRIALPADIMYSHQRVEIYRLLHEIGSSVEIKAKKMGYANSRAYAGGSCKKVFCSEYLDCNVLANKGDCRNPDIARPSMSGFGVDVKKLMMLAGWDIESSDMKPACGLVLIADE